MSKRWFVCAMLAAVFLPQQHALERPGVTFNGWLLRLARVRSPGKTVWLMFAPPGAPRVVLLESYLRAIADTGTWGGKWVVTLDSDLQAGLARGDGKALATWKAIAAAVAFFERRRAWNGLEPLGVIEIGRAH